MEDLVEVKMLEEGIALLTLNRPSAANALSRELLHALSRSLEKISEDHSLRTVILTGAGTKAFCAGADLKERAGMNETDTVKTVALIGKTISALEELPVPVIAAINGAAFGGGLELALACDIRLASETAKLGLTETSLGIIPGAGGTQRLPRIAGVAVAKELIYTARKLDARTAQELKIVSGVFSPEQLLPEAKQLAREMSRNAPLALRAAKSAINEGVDLPLDQGLEAEKRWYQTTISSNDRLEGLKAFKEKRKPMFTGN
ncbi:enoyl-CoA hydratase-related protein [Bacillus massiliglaciei]|uniref:enoyl-CoA hydratase-related protein n=1 Tax=Bacillus massiliglaciei TaxID=1816693 RepID=UPI000B3232F7|nr:enoyl-CoA hydratase-related protein [Bacillus massiliglaciei]